MSIKKIYVSNFKSFEDIEVELGKFNVLIGANASGKSNFVQIFKFIKDIMNSGLKNAISMQGGIEYIRNINIGFNKNLLVKIVIDKEFGWLVKKEQIAVKIFEMTYEFVLEFNKRGLGFKIAKDMLTSKCKFLEVEKRNNKIEEKKELGGGEINIFNINGKINIDFNRPKNVPIDEDEIYLPLLKEKEFSINTLLLETPIYLFPFLPQIEGILSNIPIYDFDPKLPKKATPITGKAELEEDGNNLAIVLKNIIENKNEKRKLFNLVGDLLPFIDKVDVERFADKSLLFKLKEKYFENQYIPASLISDGTINIAALIIALFFEKKPLTIIEEPERNIHPHLISKVVDIMKDASRGKQIIVTTHNPEVVKYAGLDNLLLVSRDMEGFSVISRPADNTEVKKFLENELGIEELYIQDLLGAA